MTGTPRILIIDDDQMILDLAKAHLESLTDREVLTACGGVESLAVLRSFKPNHFDIISLDLSMPDIDGIEAANEISKRGWQIPIYALSANHDIEIKPGSQYENFTGALRKPVNKRVIDKLVAEYMDKALNKPS